MDQNGQKLMNPITLHRMLVLVSTSKMMSPFKCHPLPRSMGRDKTKGKGKDKASESDDLKEMSENVQGIKDRMDKTKIFIYFKNKNN